MKLEVKKIDVKSSVTKGLPLWYNYIIYNELMNDELMLLDAKENDTLGGYHFYHKSNKPISKIIDFTNLEFINEDDAE